jgi:hypothetical protein
MSHTIYDANGKVSDIHRCMCELFQIKQCDKCQRNNPLKPVVRELHPIKVNDKLIITCFCDITVL